MLNNQQNIFEQYQDYETKFIYGIETSIKKSNNYINATRILEHFNESTTVFLSSETFRYAQNQLKSKSKFDQNIQTTLTIMNDNRQLKQHDGLYIHPLLLQTLLRYISSDFEYCISECLIHNNQFSSYMYHTKQKLDNQLTTQQSITNNQNFNINNQRKQSNNITRSQAIHQLFEHQRRNIEQNNKNNQINNHNNQNSNINSQQQFQYQTPNIQSNYQQIQQQNNEINHSIQQFNQTSHQNNQPIQQQNNQQNLGLISQLTIQPIPQSTIQPINNDQQVVNEEKQKRINEKKRYHHIVITKTINSEYYLSKCNTKYYKEKFKHWKEMNINVLIHIVCDTHLNVTCDDLWKTIKFLMKETIKEKKTKLEFININERTAINNIQTYAINNNGIIEYINPEFIN